VKSVSFVAINFFLLSLFGTLFSKANAPNLLSLLDDNQPKTTTAVVLAKSTNLDSLLDAAPKNSAKTAEPQQHINSLLESVLNKQSNPDLQAALHILSDAKIRDAYHEDLMYIQLFFLDYSTQILQNYSDQEIKNKKQTNLTEFLQKITPNSTKPHASNQLSDLVKLLQNQPQKELTEPETKIKINLVSLLQNSPSSPPAVVEKPKAVLGQLLQDTSAQKPMVAKSKKDLDPLLKPVTSSSSINSNDLLDLLTAGRKA
jgi:hypothetical protein